MTEAQLKRDRDECFAQSIGAGAVSRLGLRIDRDAYRACMEGRGYQVSVAMTPEVPGLVR